VKPGKIVAQWCSATVAKARRKACQKFGQLIDFAAKPEANICGNLIVS